jgi:hypothetical protein
MARYVDTKQRMMMLIGCDQDGIHPISLSFVWGRWGGDGAWTQQEDGHRLSGTCSIT